MNDSLTTLFELRDGSGRQRGQACCVSCGNEVNEADFYDGLSRTEFKISGLCQSCQDEFFGSSPEDDMELT